MFKLFRKKVGKQIHSWEYELLKAISDKMPTKYSFLKSQTNSDFILDAVPNELLNDGWKRIISNLDMARSVEQKDTNYKLVGIKVLDNLTRTYKNIELDLYEGILIGYRIDETAGELDFSGVDVSEVKEAYYENDDKDALEEIIGMKLSTAIVSKLDIDNTFIANLPEGEFFVIKDLEDGNYLSMDRDGAVYGMIHDPYEIEKLFDKKEDFFEALDNGSFDIDSYYEKKMS